MPPSSATGPTLFLVEPPGLIRASSGDGGDVFPRAGHSAKEVLGLDWATLERVARTTGVIDAGAGSLHLEPLLGADGCVAAILVRTRATRAFARPVSVAPPSSARLDRGLKFLVGRDVSTRAAVDLALRFGKTSLPILIGAETGSGADVLARALHAGGARAQAPFVHVGASSLSKSAVSAALFSAAMPHPAAEGILFVEDIHELELDSQNRLARELDRGQLASTQLVCSAPPDVRDRAMRGGFSRDLHTLVRGSSVVLPPLRDREDLGDLVRQILPELGSSELELTASALEALKSYWWPGNLAELWACLEHAVVVADGRVVLDRAHFPAAILAPPPPGNEGLRRSSERAAVEEALRVAQGNVSVAARRLGVARSTLYRLMQRHALGK